MNRQVETMDDRTKLSVFVALRDRSNQKERDVELVGARIVNTANVEVRSDRPSQERDKGNGWLQMSTACMTMMQRAGSRELEQVTTAAHRKRESGRMIRRLRRGQ